MSHEHNFTTTVTPKEHSTVQITGEIPYETLQKHRAAALAHLGKNVSIDGFRKGHIPEAVLIKHVGEMNLLSEMAERALAETYPHIIEEHQLDVIGHPQITITKLAPDNPFGFTAKVAVVPEVTLPDYKTIAAGIKKEDATISDSELEESIANILRQKVAYERMQEKAAAKEKQEADGTTLPTPETVEKEDEAEAPLPALTDEYVKTLGDFSSVDEFKSKLREHLAKEKVQEVIGKHRATITDKIIDGSTIELPQVLIDAEIGQMFGQMEQDLTRANLQLEDYLGHIKKTRDDLAKEWTPAAEKRAKLQLVLNEIAKVEKIEAPEDAVAKEVEQLVEHYKDADPARVRLYVASTLRNDEVMKMLEALSEKK